MVSKIRQTLTQKVYDRGEISVSEYQIPQLYNECNGPYTVGQ